MTLIIQIALLAFGTVSLSALDEGDTSTAEIEAVESSAKSEVVGLLEQAQDMINQALDYIGSGAIHTNASQGTAVKNSSTQAPSAEDALIQKRLENRKTADSSQLIFYGQDSEEAFEGKYATDLPKDWMGRPWYRYLWIHVVNEDGSDELKLNINGWGWRTINQLAGDGNSAKNIDPKSPKKIYVAEDPTNFLLSSDLNKIKPGQEYAWIVTAKHSGANQPGEERKSLNFVIESVEDPSKKVTRKYDAHIVDTMDSKKPLKTDIHRIGLVRK